MSTHTAIATTAKGVLDEIQVATEQPGNGEVLIKVSHGAMIAVDSYTTDLGFLIETYPLVMGFSAAGTVTETGPGVTDLKAGDRVAAFSFHGSRSKALQQYSIQPSNLCAKIPHTLSFEDAATIPDNFVTAFYTLFNQLSLPVPSSFPALTPPPLATAPILVYGAGSIAGQYCIALLNIAGYKNIIATASPKHHDHLRSLGASKVFDYHSQTLADDVIKAADGKVDIAIDAITSEGTLREVGKVINPLGTVALLLPIKEGSSVRGASDAQMHMALPEHWDVLPKGTKHVGVRTFLFEQDEYLKENLMPKILPQLLELGLIKPSRVRLMDKGSFKERVEAGLDLLRNNRVSGEKVIVKVNP